MRRKAIRFLLVLLAAVVAVPAVPTHLDSTAGAAQRKKRRKRANAASRRQQQLRRQAEARRRAARQQAANNGAAANGNNAGNRDNTKKSTGTKKEKTSGERRPDTEVRAVIKSWKETQEFIAKQKGKVVVVDFWASWCEPCVKELPELVALQKKHPKDVVTISFNLDNDGTEDLKKTVLPNVLKTLKKVKAVEVRNIVSKDTDEQTYKQTKLDSVPAIFVYDQKGSFHKRIDVNAAGGKDVSYEKHVVPVVEKLLKNKKP